MCIQAYIRGTLARKKVRELLEERKHFVRSVIRVQSCVRSFLTRCRLKRSLAYRSNVLSQIDGSFENTEGCSQSTLEEAVRQLQLQVCENERLQVFYSNILEACQRKLTEDSFQCERNVTKKQAIKANCVPSVHDKNIAAIKIQAWFRGYRDRSRLRVHLQQRRSFMAAYRGNIAAEQPSHVVDSVALNSRPVSAKIHDAVEMLFDSKMYISKVGAFILNRLSALSPHFCAYLVMEAQGLVAILDILEQKTTGRGPATAEILIILQEVFLRIVECQHPVVVAEVDAQLEDCAKAALHIFHAFYTYPVIVDGFGRAILALYRRPGAKKYFEKAPFYLNYATRRFNRLAETDPRKAILLSMKNEMC
ncbi:hypothetical protein DICVIV_08163 [Dictyocaulus viviparus]|uniref:Uncharacterized protein n=1 Tax=Dictyocaulus viviparus TaxID=29172 RepID=A0A0D8XPV8_DICVI|nr:hypothetical protein DICVIV_08163 [Dictyocaulus viviparus]